MPAVFLNVLRMCLLALWVLLGGLAAAHAESVSEPVSSGTVEKLQDRVIELEKETAVLKAELGAKIEAQDSRIADGIGLHGAQVTMLSNQTAQLGNLIQWMAIGIAVVGLIGGLFAFHRAKQIAKERAELWFKENDTKLREEIEGLKTKVQQACDDIDQQRDNVVKHAGNFFDELLRKKNHLGIFSDEGIGSTGLTRQQLEKKSRGDWTAADFGVYGYFLYQNKEYQEALDALSKQIDLLENSPSSSNELMLATAFLNKGDLFVELGRSEDAVVVYEEVERRFGEKTGVEWAERLARASVQKGFALLKQGRLNDAISVYDKVGRDFNNPEFMNKPEFIGWVATALGGKGVALSRLGDITQSKVVFAELVQQFGGSEIAIIQQIVTTARMLLLASGGTAE